MNIGNLNHFMDMKVYKRNETLLKQFLKYMTSKEALFSFKTKIQNETVYSNIFLKSFAE